MFHDVSLVMMIHEASRRWILAISSASHREAPTLSELQIIQEMSQVLVLHHSRPTKYLLIFAGGSIFAGLGDDVYHEKVPKVTSVRQREGDICGLAASVCCYSFYRNKCFVSVEYGRESSLSGRLYLYGTLTSQAFITLEDAREISS